MRFRSLLLCVLAAPSLALMIAPASADDVFGSLSLPSLPSFPSSSTSLNAAGAVDPQFKNEWEFGTRYFFSTGSTRTTLYDTTGASRLSRLTWGGQSTNDGELYANFHHWSGLTLKGFGGFGGGSGGHLTDEDYPYAGLLDSYSSTHSNGKSLTLGYVQIDGGYMYQFNPSFAAGPLVGWSYITNKMSAYGCQQTAGNPDICNPTIPSNVLAITNDFNWNAVRVGLQMQAELTPQLRWSGDVAYLPYVHLSGTDTHWLRLGADFYSGTPFDGVGQGVQVDTRLDYKVTDYFDVGVGGRYWNENAKGYIHFEDSVAGAKAQVAHYSMDRLGGYLQAAWRF